MTGSRRQFLKMSSCLAGIGWWGGTNPAWTMGEIGRDSIPADGVKLSSFRIDVTPPLGHSLCGGWITPAEAIDDRLEAIGIVLHGTAEPIVICAVDWTGILNRAHVELRQQIAEGVGTSPDRVAIQCVHQHNAPFACLDAQEIVASHEDLPPIVDRDFFHDVLDRLVGVARESMSSAERVTGVATGQARVERVASNRRFLGSDGKVSHWRGSRCADPDLRALPEGVIDPFLKSVVFMNGDRQLAAMHYYATHPMSFYGDGRVTSDFAGLARKRLQSAHPECTQIYFTGCAGNVAAGKYNDGSPAARVQLTDRLSEAMHASLASLHVRRLERLSWRQRPLRPVARTSFNETALLEQIADESLRTVDRNRAAFQLAWLRRNSAADPLVLSCLQLDNANLLHLPAEVFVEYQLAAQSRHERSFVATAAYGDGGPWYIPTREAYPQGGYEVSVAFSEPSIDPYLSDGIGELLDSE